MKPIGLTFLCIVLAACASVTDRADYTETEIETLQLMMASGTLTSEDLVAYYLDRINTVDRNGAMLNSVIEINPDALEIARALDQERITSGPRGPLHGIPVALKANIGTADAMTTTAGSLAMAGHIAPTDAFLVQQLREAGAVIIAKTNLSEWANFRSAKSSSGWSSIGGQTKNPYDLLRNPCGSSSGSAVAVAANLTSVAVGTETDGSVVCPSGANGIVGVKPSLGLISRSGIIPLAHSQDTAGPMTRTVRDAALLMNAMVGADANDRTAEKFPGKVLDFTSQLDTQALQGARIGVIRNYSGAGDDNRVDTVFSESIATLATLGAQIVESLEPDTTGMGDVEYDVLLYEFKADLNAYLQNTEAPRRNLAEVIEFNRANASTVMPHFQQEILEAAQQKGPLTDAAYLEALATSKRIAQHTIDSTMAEYDLDALVAPTNGPAWMTDHINGDSLSGVFSSSYAAVSGYATVTVPAGHIEGMPIGLSFIGGAYSDAQLLGYAYAFEQASKQRRQPPKNTQRHHR